MNSLTPFEIIRTSELTEETRRALYEWDPDPFRSHCYGLTWRPKTDHLLIHQDGHPASHVGITRETLSVDGAYLSVGGLGDVITVPEYGGRGLAQAGIAKALEIIWTEWNLTYALLFCFPPLRGFYERLGWNVIEAPIWIEQPTGIRQLPVLCLSASRKGEPWPRGPVKINGLPW